MEHDIGLAPSGFLTGVKLADANEDISTRLKRWYLIYRIETDARGLDRCWKKGTLGQISWKTHEFHPFIRPLAVGPPAIAKVLTKVGQRITALSKAVPQEYHKDMPMVAIYRRQKATPFPRGLVLVHFYGSLFYICAEYPMADRDFWFQIHRLLNSPSVKHITFNRGFDDKFIWGPEMAKSIIPMNAEQPAGWKPQWCSSMIVENECEKSESTMDAERTAGEIPGSGSIEKECPLFNSYTTHCFEHKGVQCQVMIDMTGQFESPDEI